MAQKWNSKVNFPTENYILRCIDEGFGPSNSSGKPMITLKFEVVAPENVEVNGEQFTVAGVEIQYYAVTQSINESGEVNVEKTENIKKRLDALTTAFGLPEITDAQNPPLGFKGKSVWATVRSDVQEKRKSPTAEQLAKGQRQGDVLLNPITGRPLVNYWPKIEEIFGLAN